MTVWIFISDSGPMGFGYLGIPFTLFMNIGGVLSAVQLVRKSDRMAYLLVNSIFTLVGLYLTFLFIVEVWNSILEKVSTVWILLGRAVIDKIILGIPFTKCSAGIRKTVDDPIAFYTYWCIL